MGTNLLGEHAVVLGAGMSGLLAARVLADRFRAVTIVERDERDLTPCVGHAQSQECAGGSEMIQPDGKEKLPR